MDFNREYEICVNTLIYNNYHSDDTKKIASDIYREWEYELLKISTCRFYKKDYESYYAESIELRRQELLLYSASDVLWGKDFVTFVQESRLYVSKSKSDNHKIYDLDEFCMKNEFPPLFLLKIYTLPSMEIIDFLKYQLAVNFENDINKFKEYYNSLKHYSIENKYLDIFSKRNDIILEYLINHKTDDSNELSENLNELPPLNILTNSQFYHFTVFFLYYLNSEDLPSKAFLAERVSILAGKRYYKGNYFYKTATGTNYLNEKCNSKNDISAIKGYLTQIELTTYISAFEEYAEVQIPKKRIK